MSMPKKSLSDGRSIPAVGFGTWKLYGDEARVAVREAIAAGYRLIDTAAIYENEAEVAEGIAESGVPQEEIFVTTKVWHRDNGFDSTLRAFDESLAKLQREAVDLYLIHWPAPSMDRYVDTWRALIRLRDEGRARSIGVCNFHREYLQRLVDETGETPSINQVELHPFFQQRDLRAFHEAHGILTEAWSPLAKGGFLDHPLLVELAKKHGKTQGQIVLRWHFQQGIIAIPKTSHPARMRENLGIFDFGLDEDDLRRMAGLDRPTRISNDPAVFGS